MTTNPTVLSWVEEIRRLVKPEKELWIDGSKEQIAELQKLAIEEGLLKPLNDSRLPGCTLHRTTLSDAARTEQRNFVCTENPLESGPANNRLTPSEIKPKLTAMFGSVMADRTMYVIPFYLGNPDGLGLHKAGIQITDSVYVVLNTVILANCGKSAVNILDSLGEDGEWFKGIHSTGNTESRRKSDPESKEDVRYVCHFTEENSVWAINTGYAGNAFLTKKSMALRLASNSARQEGWLAEHMAIIELTAPDSEPVYIAAAFPSGCGKTALAMSDIPGDYAAKGYKIRCISDDIAWLKKGSDGRLWAINPETGIFGSAPGVSGENTPNVLATARKNAIFTNVVHNVNDNTVWWEGLEGNEDELADAIDWKGNPWVYTPPEAAPAPFIIPTVTESAQNHNNRDDNEDEDGFDEEKDYDRDEEEEDEEVAAEPNEDIDSVDEKSVLPVKIIKGAHPNSRFTAPITGCPVLSDRYNDPQGVPISAIIFGGRRSKSVPLVYQAFDWEHGVFVGTALGTEPIVPPGTGNPSIRRDPMAMGAYCGYNMADYWQHWLKMGKKLGRNAPKIFNVNWFKAGETGVPMWPGFGENIRVLEWIFKRLKQQCAIIETPLGYSPKPDDINIDGLNLPPEILKSLLVVDKTQWKEDVNSMKQFYGKFGKRLPEKLREQLIDLEKRLMNS